MSILGATKLQDENVTALRMAGLFPDEYMIKLINFMINSYLYIDNGYLGIFLRLSNI